MNGKWAIANEKLIDFLEDGFQNNHERMIELTKGLIPKFSFFVVALDEKNGAEFKKLYDFAVELHESSFTGSDKLAIILKAFEIMEEVFPDFYTERKPNILQLFHEMVKAPIVNIELMMMIKAVDQKRLAYPDFVNIQISEMERLLGYFDDDIDEVEELMQKLKPGSKINRDVGV